MTPIRTAAAPPATATFQFVVPAYGEAPYLASTLGSLLAQTTPVGITVRWVRPPSLRPAVAHLRDSPAVRWIDEPRSRGIGGDWNAALETSSATWTCLAHADDLYDPSYAAALLEAVRAFPDAAVVFTDATYVDPRWQHRLLHALKRWINPATRWRRAGGHAGQPRLLTPGQVLSALRFGCFIPCPTVSVRQDRLRVALGERGVFSGTLQTALDWDAWIRIAQAGLPFVYVPRQLVTLRVHAGTATQDTIRTGVRSAEERHVMSRLWGPAVGPWAARALLLGQRLQQLRHTPGRAGLDRTRTH